MRYVNEKFEPITEDDVDLEKGYLTTTTAIREDAEPIDNITKFAWNDNDYEEVQVYSLNPERELSPQDDTDAMAIDHEYRLTLLELGLQETIKMLYRTLKRMIERGNTKGIEKKLDVFYAADKLTEAEYTELLALYQNSNKN